MNTRAHALAAAPSSLHLSTRGAFLRPTFLPPDADTMITGQLLAADGSPAVQGTLVLAAADCHAVGAACDTEVSSALRALAADALSAVCADVSLLPSSLQLRLTTASFYTPNDARLLAVSGTSTAILSCDGAPAAGLSQMRALLAAVPRGSLLRLRSTRMRASA